MNSPTGEDSRFSRFENSEEERESFKKFLRECNTGCDEEHFEFWLEVRELVKKSTERDGLSGELLAEFYKKYLRRTEKTLFISLTKEQHLELHRVSQKSGTKLGDGIAIVLPQVKSIAESILSSSLDLFLMTSKWGFAFLGNKIETVKKEVKCGGFNAILKWLIFDLEGTNFFFFKISK